MYIIFTLLGRRHWGALHCHLENVNLYKSFPRLGCSTERHQQLEMPRFKADRFTRKHAGAGWEMGFPSCWHWRFQISTSSSSWTKNKGTTSAGFAHRLDFCRLKTIPLFSNHKLHLQNGIAFQTRERRLHLGQLHFFPPSDISATLSHRQLQFQLVTILICKTNFTRKLQLISYMYRALWSLLKPAGISALNFVLGYISQLLVQSAASEPWALFIYLLPIENMMSVITSSNCFIQDSEKYMERKKKKYGRKKNHTPFFKKNN